MTAWLDTLISEWDDLAQTAPIERQFRSKLLAADLSIDILVALRAGDDAPCLVLQAAAPPDTLFELGGMRLSTASDPSGPLLVLSLEDDAKRDLFATICADVVEAATSAGSTGSLERFLARLGAWRQFLRDRHVGLSRSERIGLIGELLVLERLVAGDSRALVCWCSPDDGLHDFVSEGQALEVKTTLGPAPGITISRLDQLDASGLRRLDLLHVRLIEEPRGRAIQDVISDINGHLGSDADRRAFANTLLRRGLMPDDDAARTSPRVRLRAIDAYEVRDDFPRLIRSKLSAAITEATYILEVRALTKFAQDSPVVLGMFAQGDEN